ncbi:MAG TPA: hypothetical protein VKU00_10125 [Chthonomonadaceae bacterium]|nr:hypothetical protein [Chthonomonadaceae bacterium]
MRQQHLPQENNGPLAYDRIDTTQQVRSTEGETDEERVSEEAVTQAAFEGSETQTKSEVADPLSLVLRRDARRRLATMILMPLVPIAYLLTLRGLLDDTAWIQLCNNPAFVVLTLLFPGITIPILMLRPSRKAKRAAQQLSSRNDLSGIGGLIETLYFSDQREGPAIETLIALLPRLQASDSDLLTERHHAVLRGTLSSLPHVTGNLFTRLSRRKEIHARLQVAILKAFEQVGDSKALPVVAALAESAAHPQVRAAAVECLPFLQMRQEQERASQTLLRASSASATEPDMLLRAAHENHDQDPNEMVRPSLEPEPETQSAPSESTQFRPYRTVAA